MNNDPCHNLPCGKGGSCITMGTSGQWRCTCSHYYSGVRCEVFYDDRCLNNPCQNGGTCIVSVLLCQFGVTKSDIIIICCKKL